MLLIRKESESKMLIINKSYRIGYKRKERINSNSLNKMIFQTLDKLLPKIHFLRLNRFDQFKNKMNRIRIRMLNPWMSIIKNQIKNIGVKLINFIIILI